MKMMPTKWFLSAFRQFNFCHTFKPTHRTPTRKKDEYEWKWWEKNEIPNHKRFTWSINFFSSFLWVFCWLFTANLCVYLVWKIAWNCYKGFPSCFSLFVRSFISTATLTPPSEQELRRTEKKSKINKYQKIKCITVLRVLLCRNQLE